MEVLRELEKQHFDVISNNNWEDTKESIELANKFKEVNKSIGEHCIECNSLSNIHCQYH